MYSKIKYFLKIVSQLLLPKLIYDLLYNFILKINKKSFFNQRLSKVKCGNFEILAPSNHLLINFQSTQPFRDLCIGITAKFVCEKYPNSTIIDVGANIGDTAAIIATYTKSKMILVEGSDYFFDILNLNVKKISNETVLHKAFVSDGSKLTGSLHYWGGTSFFKESNDKNSRTINSVRLCEIADGQTTFVKIDTDGYDFKILLDSIDWLSNSTPAILFENSVRNLEDFVNSQQLFSKLRQIGYQYFIIWDDAGYHIVSTKSLEVISDLNSYLLKIWNGNGHKSIYNYDILCLHSKDEDIHNYVNEWYKNY